MFIENSLTEARARRAAKRVGLQSRKSRWRLGTIDNRGGFILVAPETNSIVCGEKFDMTSEAVIEFCSPDWNGWRRQKARAARHLPPR